MPQAAAFFGTPQAALPTFEALLGSSHHVVAAVTAPDRPRGRGMQVLESPLAERAAEAGVPVLKPPSLRDSAVEEQLGALAADVFVVVAYGLILPKEVLSIPRLGCLNVHFSLLPRLRGAAPVQWALIEGYPLTGVTVIQMDEGLDSGPILGQTETSVLAEDTAGTLGARLARGGATLLLSVLEEAESGRLTPQPQNHALATMAPKLSSEDARIRWGDPAEAIVRRVRAFDPRPGAWTTLHGRRLKIWQLALSPVGSVAAPGTIEVSTSGTMAVDTGTARVVVEEIQPEGGRRMTAAELLRGHRVRSGESLE